MKLKDWLDQPPEVISDEEIGCFIEVIRNTKAQTERVIREEGFDSGGV